MKGLILLALLFALNAVHASNLVVCYYGTWAAHRSGQGKFSVGNIDPHLCTHLVYAFASIDSQGNVISFDPKLDLADDGGADNFRLFNELKQKNTALKTLLAVGGWNAGSAKFSSMAASPALRKNFIESAILMINKHGFNGIVISWLSPNQRDSSNHQADVDNFSVLLKEMRVYFDQNGLLLTVAVTAAEESASKSYDIASLVQYVHLVNLITHDFHGPWEATTNHNAALHRGEGAENVAAANLLTADVAVQYWVQKGCPPSKLVLGIPFFGHTYKLRYARINGVNAPATGPGISGPYTQLSGAIGYFELCNIIRTQQWTVERDGLAQVPYAFSGENWVSYDDTVSVKAKVNYARRERLAGVMVWSLETDDFNNICGGGNFPLLHVVNQVINEESEIVGGTTDATTDDFTEDFTDASDETTDTTDDGSTVTLDFVVVTEPTEANNGTSESTNDNNNRKWRSSY